MRKKKLSAKIYFDMYLVNAHMHSWGKFGTDSKYLKYSLTEL